MKIVIPKASLNLALKWAQRGFFAGAIAMLGYSAWVLTDSAIFQHREKQRLDRLTHSQGLLRTVAVKAGVSIGRDGLIGRLEVARLGVSVAVIEGTDQPTLRRAAGHISGTALPGQAGNIGIAGHRDTFFRPLRNVQRDDIITLNTAAGEYRYRVVSTKIVSPKDVAVLNSDGNEVLTLVTCYPFYFVGAAPNRFIVRAERIAG